MFVQILNLQSANSIIHKAIKSMVCSSKESTIKSTVTIVTKLFKYSIHANDQNLQGLDVNSLIFFELILTYIFF